MPIQPLPPEIDRIVNPWKYGPLGMGAGMPDQPVSGPQVPGPVGGGAVVGQQIPGGGPAPGMFPGLQEVLAGQAPPAAMQATAPLPPPPVLPQADYSQVPKPQPLSTPEATSHPTRRDARFASIAKGLQGFREGAQRGEAIADRRAANKYRMAEQRIASITNDATLAPEAKQEKIAEILNDKDVQRGARAAGVELPMLPDEGKKPGMMSRIGGALMSGVTGVPQQPRAGQVDVGALPQMSPQAMQEQRLKQADTEDRLLWAEAKKRLPLEVRDMALKIAAGVEVSAEDKAKYAAEVQKALAAARAAQELQAQRDKAAAERQRTGIAATAEQGKVRDEAAERRARIGAAGRIGAAERSQRKDFGQAGSLRDDYNRDLKQINFPDISSSAARITTAAKNPTPAGDLSVIYSYMKMLDPGSVVRESEFRVAETARPMLERVGLNWNAVKSVWEGKRLTDSARNDFVGKAASLYESAAAQKKEIDTHYRGIAERNGLNPQDIIRDAASPASTTKVGDTVTYQGKRYRVLGINPDGTAKLGEMSGK